MLIDEDKLNISMVVVHAIRALLEVGLIVIYCYRLRYDRRQQQRMLQRNGEEKCTTSWEGIGGRTSSVLWVLQILARAEIGGTWKSYTIHRLLRNVGEMHCLDLVLCEGCDRGLDVTHLLSFRFLFLQLLLKWYGAILIDEDELNSIMVAVNAIRALLEVRLIVMYVRKQSLCRERQLNERLSQLPESSQSSTTRDDIFTQVMGEDRRGRVRTFGLGVTPFDIFGPRASIAEARAAAAEARAAAVELAMERSQRIALQEEVVQMRTQLNQLMTWMQSFTGSGLSSSSSVPVSGAAPNDIQRDG